MRVTVNPDTLHRNPHVAAHGYLEEKCLDTIGIEPSSTTDCFHHLFEQQVQRTPSAVALRFKDRQLTYEQLDAASNQLAALLRERGVGVEQIIGLCVERGIESFVFILGVMKAGAAYVHIDPNYPPDRIELLIEDAGLSIVVATAGTADKLRDLPPAITVLQPTPAFLAGYSAENPRALVGAGNLAYVIYTSGSTGKPKGALLVHAGLCNLARAQSRDFAIGPGTPVLQFSRLSFDGSVTEMAMTLSAGGTLCLAETHDLIPGSALAATLEKYQVQVVTLPPSALVFLAEYPLPKLRCVITAGEACPVEVAKTWAARCELINAYGPTENTVCATFHRCTQVTGNLPLGAPIDGVEVFLLDGDLQPVRDGEPAELFIAGIGLARGYLGRPALTAERFLPNPFSSQPGARLYRTGDLVMRRADGAIEYVGRIDHQVKLRGFRIELGEIERLLMAHAGILQAVAIVREDTPGDKRLVAYVVGSEGTQERQLLEYLSARVPDYMVPSMLVKLERLPLSVNGKVDRAALPKPEQRSETPATAAPQTPVEHKIATIWRDLLGVRNVGIHDEFKDLGGYSLLAVRIATRLNEAFDVELPMWAVLDASTISAQAELIGRHLQEAAQQVGTG
jgi:amino acid adenylation domain-containing protein